MGDDLNVLRVDCAVRTPSPANTNATLLLPLTVKDSAFAMAESAPDAVVHRSQRWNCRNETILGRLRNATLIDAHSITLLLDFQGSATVSTRATLVMQGVVAFPPFALRRTAGVLPGQRSQLGQRPQFDQKPQPGQLSQLGPKSQPGQQPPLSQQLQLGQQSRLSQTTPDVRTSPPRAAQQWAARATIGAPASSLPERPNCQLFVARSPLTFAWQTVYLRKS